MHRSFSVFQTSHLPPSSPPPPCPPRDPGRGDVQQDPVHGRQAGLGEPLRRAQPVRLLHGAVLREVSSLHVSLLIKQQQKAAHPASFGRPRRCVSSLDGTRKPASCRTSASFVLKKLDSRRVGMNDSFLERNTRQKDSFESRCLVTSVRRFESLSLLAPSESYVQFT